LSDRPRIFSGSPAAPGRVVGSAWVVRVEDPPEHVPEGAVLVIRVLHPYQAPLLFRVGAVITEEGGLLQHATTLAREFGVPAVVGLAGATEIFRDGDRLEVRGDTGEVLLLEA
jgi:phosphohistidine swiveling domain-containing protein